MQNHKIRRLVIAGLTVGSLTAGGLASTAAAAAAATSPKAGSTLTVPLVASFPNSNLPFYSGAQCTTTNIDYWDLTARPGLWFGLGNSISLQTKMSPLSVGHVGYSGADTVATVSVKGWNWSDAAGHLQRMTTRDVMFWLNMDRAQSNGGFAGAACGFVPGFGEPNELLNAVPSGNNVTLTFKGHQSITWTIYNQLSQIVPMANAWDTTGSPANCAGEAYTAVKEDGTDICTTVFNYLSGLQINNAIWNWADGPYRQKSAQVVSGSPTGNDVQVANTHYSGPASTAAHAVKTIVYRPYSGTSAEQAETADLQANKLDIGTVDPSNVSPSPGPGKAGHNLLPHMGNYKTLGSVDYGVFYYQFNFGNAHSTWTAPKSQVWVDLNNQTYFRQAMMSSVDQANLIKHVDNGYAVPTYSAVPTYPKNSNNKGVKNTWSYSTTRGKTIMKAHGWNTNVFPDECTLHGAAGCGNAQYPIPFGSRASETVLIPSGDQPPITIAQDQANEIKAASGIQMKVNATLTPNQVQTDCFGAEQGAWQICGYGGWIFAPDYYPSGEVLFVLGSSSNSGGYPSAEMQALMADTTISGNIALNGNNPKYHTSYAQFSATDVPFLWQPTPAGFIEQAKSLVGNPAPSPLTNFNPEYITAI